jgi:arginase family enzyme
MLPAMTAPAPILIAGSPTALGGHFAGMEQGPRELRAYGLLERLGARPGLASAALHDHGDTANEPGWAPDPDPRMKNRQRLIEYLPRFAAHVAATLAAADDRARLMVLGGDCTSHPAAMAGIRQARPGTRLGLAWFDAHGDFNTPETTPSGFLGGMCLAGACGLWDAGLDAGPALDPTQVVMCGVRDLDAKEGVLVETRGVDVIARPSLLAGALEGREVFVHLDCDVLDPSIMPARFEANGGLSDGGLRTLLTEVAEAGTLVGCEITAFGTPDMAEVLASIVEPLLPLQSEQ